MKKFFIFILIIAVAAAAFVFIYRYQIFQYSAEKVIRNLLPDYIRIDKIAFDLKNSRVVLGDFKIVNPEGFSAKYLLEIESITCRYRMLGKSLLDGFEVLEPIFRRPVLNIERSRSSRVNLLEMEKSLNKGEKKTAPAPSEVGGPAPAPESKKAANLVGNKALADMIKLPETFSLKEGKIVFIDSLPYGRPYLVNFENIDAKVSLKLNPSYSAILAVASTGEGELNGRQEEVVRWNVTLDPTTPRLTMSNRFDVSNLDLLVFEPYYDKYSPFIFKKGRFSGTLVFDFDNGNIGSTNEIHLSNFVFYIKRGYENAAFWETSVQDLAKYFTSPYGEIVFDFKIKGEMSNPKFYLGPISKQALASMAIDKISQAIQSASGPGQPAPGAPKSDIQKAKEYIDLFQGLINKK